MSYYYFLEEVPVVQRWNFAVPNFVIIISERFLGVSFARLDKSFRGNNLYFINVFVHTIKQIIHN